jgi:hypothetical protein
LQSRCKHPKRKRKEEEKNGLQCQNKDLQYVFGSVVLVIFQNIFHAEMHQNNFFYFLKIIFEISTSKLFKI